MMRRKISRFVLAGLVLVGGILPLETSAAPADEAAFLNSLEGR